MAIKNNLSAAREFAQGLLNDPFYRENLRLRLMAGELPPNLEAMLFHYAYGKPVETLEVHDERAVEKMTDEELVAMAEQMRALVPSTVSTVN